MLPHLTCVVALFLGYLSIPELCCCSGIVYGAVRPASGGTSQKRASRRGNGSRKPNVYAEMARAGPSHEPWAEDGAGAGQKPPAVSSKLHAPAPPPPRPSPGVADASAALPAEKLQLVMSRLAQLVAKLQAEEKRRAEAEGHASELVRQLHDARQREAELLQRQAVLEGALAARGGVARDGSSGEAASPTKGGDGEQGVRDALASASDQLRELHAALKKQSGELADARAENETLRARLRDAETSSGADAATTRAALNQATTEVDRVGAEAQVLRGRVAALESERASLVSQLEAAQAALKAAEDDHRSVERGVSSATARLRSRVAALQRELEEESAAKARATADSRRSLEELRTTLRKLATAEQAAAEAREEADRAMDDQRAMVERLDALRSRNERLEKAAVAAKRRAAKTAKQMGDVEGLRAAKANIEREAEALRRKIEGYRESEARLHAQLEAQRSVSPRLRGLEERSHALETIAKEATDRAEFLEHELSMSRADNSALRSSCADLQQSLTRSRIVAQGAAGEASQLRTLHGSESAAIEAFKQRADADARRIEELSARIEEVERENSQLRSDLDQAADARAAASRRLNDVAAELEAADARVRASAADISRLTAHKSSLEEALRRAKMQADEVQTENVELRREAERASRADALEAALKSQVGEAAAAADDSAMARAEAAAASRSAEDASNQVAELQERVERLTRENELLVRLSTGAGEDVEVPLQSALDNRSTDGGGLPRSPVESTHSTHSTPSGNRDGSRSAAAAQRAADARRSRPKRTERSPASLAESGSPGQRDVKSLIDVYEGRGSRLGTSAARGSSSAERKLRGGRALRRRSPRNLPHDHSHDAGADADTSLELEGEFHHTMSGSPRSTDPAGGPSLVELRDGGYKVEDMRRYFEAQRRSGGPMHEDRDGAPESASPSGNGGAADSAANGVPVPGDDWELTGEGTRAGLSRRDLDAVAASASPGIRGSPISSEGTPRPRPGVEPEPLTRPLGDDEAATVERLAAESPQSVASDDKAATAPATRVQSGPQSAPLAAQITAETATPDLKRGLSRQELMAQGVDWLSESSSDSGLDTEPGHAETE